MFHVIILDKFKYTTKGMLKMIYDVNFRKVLESIQEKVLKKGKYTSVDSLLL